MSPAETAYCLPPVSITAKSVPSSFLGAFVGIVAISYLKEGQFAILPSPLRTLPRIHRTRPIPKPISAISPPTGTVKRAIHPIMPIKESNSPQSIPPITQGWIEPSSNAQPPRLATPIAINNETIGAMAKIIPPKTKNLISFFIRIF